MECTLKFLQIILAFLGTQGRPMTLDHCLHHFISSESVKDVVCDNCTKVRSPLIPVPLIPVTSIPVTSLLSLSLLTQSWLHFPPPFSSGLGESLWDFRYLTRSSHLTEYLRLYLLLLLQNLQIFYSVVARYHQESFFALVLFKNQQKRQF